MLGKMSVIYIPLTLLLALVGDAPARAASLGGSTESLSALQYRHTDPGTGVQLMCNKCPAGTHVSRHCTQTSVRECSRCPAGSYTRRENGMDKCHRCRAPCAAPFVEKEACTASTERECACPPGAFASEGGCRPHSPCGRGWGVRRPGGEAEDVKCRLCPRGSFSDTSSTVDKCRPHTNCQALGLVLRVRGSKDSDNGCGPPPAAGLPPTLPPTAEPSGLAEASLAVETHKAFDLVSGVKDLELSPSAKGTLPSNTVSSPVDSTKMAAAVAAAATATAIGKPAATDPPRKLRLLTRDPQIRKLDGQPPAGPLPEGRPQGAPYRPPRRGSPRPGPQKRFDINEHLPWMIVLLLLLVLVVIVVCSVKRSSRVLKKGPRQDPSSIVEKAIQKKSVAPTQAKEKWIYCSNGQGVDILKLVAAQIGSQWIDMYQYLANATEREVAAFSNGYTADHERAYAAFQHWTIRDGDANLAKLIGALHRQRRIDVVEKIRCVMEDNPQFDLNQLMTSVNVTQCLSPNHKPSESPGPGTERSPVDRTKGFFADESEPLLRCDSTSSKDSALSRTGSFITKEKKDTVLRQVRLDPCDLQPIFDDMLHILSPEELRVIEEIALAEDKLDRLFEIAGVKSQEASQTLLDSVYSHLPDLL
ncbi:tumor necrosis factor receptor superfamily member 21 isoform X2 [Conger conger]|uniref:tumor necrosis factor receptor superfamily member 21 isoform X2 n=1 Tax=Conger conger TaxID=82655 RepID=UPI002A5A867D|nr:tumor necrosis factor receptor superfamily member 21 isoform X2 [Conger conger]